jgi:hypothetical protein
MMAKIGYMLDMNLDKNLHCVGPPPKNQGRFEGGTGKDCGE